MRENAVAGDSISTTTSIQSVVKSEPVEEYVPDLVVANAVVVDAKTIDAITDHEIGQALNYLTIMGLRVALILNVKRSKLQWKRIVL